MVILKRLFSKKKIETISVSAEDYDQPVNWFNPARVYGLLFGNYKKTVNFIDNLKTIEDCKIASTMIDDLGKPYPVLRDNLCDKTFKIYMENHESNLH